MSTASRPTGTRRFAISSIVALRIMDSKSPGRNVLKGYLNPLSTPAINMFMKETYAVGFSKN